MSAVRRDSGRSWGFLFFFHSLFGWFLLSFLLSLLLLFSRVRRLVRPWGRPPYCLYEDNMRHFPPVQSNLRFSIFHDELSTFDICPFWNDVNWIENCTACAPRFIYSFIDVLLAPSVEWNSVKMHDIYRVRGSPSTSAIYSLDVESL